MFLFYYEANIWIKIAKNKILILITFIDIKINVIKFAVLNLSIFKLAIFYNNVFNFIIKQIYE